MSRRNDEFSLLSEPTHHVRNFFLWLLAILTVLILATVLLSIAIGNSVALDSETVTVQNLPEDLESWSILVISDLKGREFGTKQSAIASVIGSRSFSTIVICGDMLGEDGDVQPLLDLLDVLPAGKPKLLIAGDSDPDAVAATAHGSLSVYSDWAEQAIAHGATILDEPICITRGKSNIWFVPEYLYSLDLNNLESIYANRLTQLNEMTSLTADQAAEKRACEYHIERIGRIRTSKKAMTSKDIQVAVSHTPLTDDYVASMFEWAGKDTLFSLRQASLILSGHYCGGGWCLPGGQPIYLSELGWWPDASLVRGLHYMTGIPQYISPGLGSDWNETLPGRLFNQPTMTVITLTSRLT